MGFICVAPQSVLSFGGFERSKSNQMDVNSFPRSNRLVSVVRATASVPRGKRSPNKEILMVDPLEAKRLAAKQMEELQTQERLYRQRRIEAINGAWAMIGLTAGLGIEAHTGKSFLAQLLGYWTTIITFFGQ